jgi:hypothetical protein
VRHLETHVRICWCSPKARTIRAKKASSCSRYQRWNWSMGWRRWENHCK